MYISGKPCRWIHPTAFDACVGLKNQTHAFKMRKIGFRSVTKCFQLTFTGSSGRNPYIHVLHVEVVLPSFLSHNYCRADFFRMDFILTCL